MSILWHSMSVFRVWCCNHCCFCCGHPFTMLGVSLFTSCKYKIQCVSVKKKMGIVVLICIPLLTNDIKYLCKYFLATCIYSLENCLLKSSFHFKIRLFAFCCWIVRVLLYILDTSHIQGNRHKAVSLFFCRNFAGQKGVTWYI